MSKINSKQIQQNVENFDEIQILNACVRLDERTVELQSTITDWFVSYVNTVKLSI